VPSRGLAASCYLPLPGLAWLAVLAAPADRLVRFHARQATVAVVAAYVLLLTLGWLAAAAPALVGFVAAAAGTVLAVAIVALAAGCASAAMGRYLRLRPAWDLLVR
jgi:uncharacterized membrane protein